MKISSKAPSIPVGQVAPKPQPKPAQAEARPSGWTPVAAQARVRSATTQPSRPAVDAGRTAVTLADLTDLQAKAGRKLSLGELATAYPNARIDGKGRPLAELAKQPLNKLGPDGSALTLAAGTIDKNGDVDVTRLFGAELKQFNQNLVLHKKDELPIPLEYGLRSGEFCVGDPAQQKALAGLRTTKDGLPTFDMKDVKQVEAALVALGVDPSDNVRIASELMKQGVSVPLSREDKLRRVVCGLLDSPLNYVDLDDKVVEAAHVGDHNASITPTVYGSAKVSTENPGDVILSYKRFNNHSYAAQGGKVAKLLGKDTKSQHEGDMEATFVKIDTASHELKAVLAARHSYGELYSPAQVARFQAETGLDAATIGVSQMAHGGDLVGNATRHTFAGAGEDGVREGDWKDHVLSEDFAGVGDTKAGGGSVLLKREQINLVLEADDQQTLNMKVRLGDQRKGVFGTKVLDKFNDGVRMDRFMGTSWFYKQEQLNQDKASDRQPSGRAAGR